MRRALLVTRPLPAARALRTRLALHGWNSLIEPLLQLRPLTEHQPVLDDCRAALFTSAAAVEFLPVAALPPGWADWPCYCVGDSTAIAARRQGWRKVTTGAGDGVGLTDCILARQDKTAGALLYPCGAERRDEPQAALVRHGYNLRLWPVYHAAAAQTLSHACQSALRQGRLQAVLLHSPRSASIFTTLVRQAGLAQTCADLIALCLSPSVAAAAQPLPWRAISSALQPTTASLLTCWQDCVQNRAFPPSASAPLREVPP